MLPGGQDVYHLIKKVVHKNSNVVEAEGSVWFKS